MSPLFLRIARVLLVAAMLLLFSADQVDSKVTNAPPENNGNGSNGDVPPPPKGMSMKCFDGILTGPGGPGTLLKQGYIEFRCDPKLLNWKIQVKGYNTKGQGSSTSWEGNPGVCDHVHVKMYYYAHAANPDEPLLVGGYHGIAVSVTKIP